MHTTLRQLEIERHLQLLLFFSGLVRESKVAAREADATAAPAPATVAAAEKATVAPVDEATEAPVDEVTEAPVDEATDAPIVEATEVPVDGIKTSNLQPTWLHFQIYGIQPKIVWQPLYWEESSPIMYGNNPAKTIRFSYFFLDSYTFFENCK